MVGRVGKVFREKGEIINMTVKEIFKPIMINDNVEIIDQKNYYRYWGVVKEKIYH